MVFSEANGKVLSHNLSPRKTLVAGRREVGWKSPREHYPPIFIRKTKVGGRSSQWKRKASMVSIRDCWKPGRTQQGWGEPTLGLQSVPFDIFTLCLRLVTLPRPRTRLSASVLTQLDQHRAGHAKCPQRGLATLDIFVNLLPCHVAVARGTVHLV